MNVVILGVIIKTVAVFGLLSGLWLVLCKMARERSLHRFVRQLVLAPSEFSGPARINTRRLIDTPSRAPPLMTSKRQRGSPGSFCRA
jgi:hypothetical protein